MRLFAFFLFAMTLLPSCSLSEFSSRGKICGSNGSCPDDLVCVKGVCDDKSALEETDAGMSSTPDSSTTPVADAGTDGGMNPRPTDAGDTSCSKCSATQVCENNSCVNESEIVGRSCDSAKVCPGGFQCLGEICVKNGGRYCTSLKTAPTSCLDFDASPLFGSGWQNVTNPSNEGELFVEQGGAASAPGAMASRIAPSTNSTPTARLERALPASWETVELAFDLKIETAATLTKAGDFFSAAELLCRDSNASMQEYQGAWFQFTPGVSANAATIVMLANKTADNFVEQLPTQFKINRWTRVRIDAKRNSTAKTFEATVTIDGVQQVNHKTTLCIGAWQAIVGLSAKGGSGKYLYDNVKFVVK
jgi:hypothetical protein